MPSKKIWHDYHEKTKEAMSNKSCLLYPISKYSNNDLNVLLFHQCIRLSRENYVYCSIQLELIHDVVTDRSSYLPGVQQYIKTNKGHIPTLCVATLNTF